MPDDLNILLVDASDARPTWVWANDPHTAVTEVNFFVHVTSDLAAALAWCGPEGLGLPISHTADHSSDGVNQTTGAPPGLNMTNGITANEEPGRLELAGPNLELRPFASVLDDWRTSQFPGRSLGHVLWRVVLPQRPASLASWAESRGISVDALPVRRHSRHFGDRAVGIVSGPAGLRVQLEIPGA